MSKAVPNDNGRIKQFCMRYSAEFKLLITENLIPIPSVKAHVLNAHRPHTVCHNL